MKFQQLAWLSAVVVLGGIAAVGFQGGGDKFGIVDVEKVFNDSSFAKTQTDSLRTMGEARQKVLQFVATNRTITEAQATKFKDLSLKANVSATEQAEIDRIKSDVRTSEQKFSALSTKPNPTAQEKAEFEELNKRRDASDAMLTTWQQSFMTEVEDRRASLRGEALEKVRQAIAKVAREQGCTVVFDSQVAPYAANNLTDAAVKAMN